jgi:hypothetical protein
MESSESGCGGTGNASSTRCGGGAGGGVVTAGGVATGAGAGATTGGCRREHAPAAMLSATRTTPAVLNLRICFLCL